MRLMRGDASQFPVGTGADEICATATFIDTAVDLAILPPAGTTYYYLIRAENSCGNAPFGDDSSGNPRNVTCN